MGKPRLRRMKTNPILPFSIASLLMMLIPMLVFVWMPGHEAPWYELGIYPREWKGLVGLVFAPFIHQNATHLFSNVLPLGVLSFLTLWIVGRRFFGLSLGLILLGGLLTWLIGRPSYHIGASGLIYGYVGFLMAAGIVADNVRLLAFTMLAVFLYGSMVWGLLPLQPDVSFESHISGALAGVFWAFVFKSILPKRTKYSWETEPDEPEEGQADEHEHGAGPFSGHQSMQIQYEWVSKNPKTESPKLEEED